jgi:hypothetical protein
VATIKTLSTSELLKVDVESGKITKLAEIDPGGAGLTCISLSADTKYVVAVGMGGDLMLFETDKFGLGAPKK